MKEIEKAKKIYETVPVPAELDARMQATIKNFEKGKERKSMKKANKVWKGFSMAAAACLTVAIVGLNTSEAFAMSAGELPIIGGIAKILTVRTYDEQEDNVTIKAETPAIVPEEGSQVDEAFVVDVNAEIEKLVAKHVEEMETMFEEYKKAFMETGGTEEEWQQHDLKADVTYEVKYQDEERLSLVIVAAQNAFNMGSQSTYYNINLKNGEALTLADLLGEDYVEKANTAIKAEMDRRVAEEDAAYFTGADGLEGFSTVDENTKFYLNEAGNPVVTFEKYEIAPGFMGQQEFEIK